MEEESEIETTVKKITADEEYKLEVNGFKCPDSYVTQFTPLEFEELVTNFQEFDSNKSGTIDIYEIRKILHHMDMEMSKENAQELMNLIDGDGSGEIDFDEFCAFIALTKRGDEKYTKFGKLIEKLGASPMGMLEQQAKARHFKTRFVLVEEREATATTPPLVVVELLIEGQWFSRDNGETKCKFEVKRFQGMGSDSRHAKDAAIKIALVKLKSYMPGAHLKDGEFPEEWIKWVSDNLTRGVTPVDIIETLVRKGFKPTPNNSLMHTLITSAYFDLFLKDNPEFSCESLMTTTLDIKFINWVKSIGNMGLDGEIILRTLEDRDIQLTKYHPAIADKIKYNEYSSLLDFNGKEPKLLDFYTACSEGNVVAVDLYIRGDVDVNMERMSRFGSVARTGLMLASIGNHKKVVEMLIANKANVLTTDRRGRTALHYAAINGSLDCCELLMNAGAPLFLGDNQGNTPLHLATWQNHPPTVDFLCAKGQEFTRSITSNKVLVNPGQTFEELSRLIFLEMQDTKLKPIETRRFQKLWLFEASQLFRQRMSPNVRHMIAPTCIEIMDDVLHRFDPRPETGIFVSTAIEDQLLFIPTIPSHVELAVLLQYMFRQSALDNTNNWNRTPLHLACDENTVASHRDVILLLVNKHGCNVMLKDIHNKTPYDLLVTDKSNPKAPSATSLREYLIYENRIPKTIEIMSQYEELDRKKLDEKREQILLDCIKRAEFMNTDLWEATRLASSLLSVYGKITGNIWSHYMDPDTKNEFFCCQPKDIGLGDSFSGFSWNLPDAIRNTYHHDVAFLYQRISQSVVIRQIENWVTLKSNRYNIIYYFNVDSNTYTFELPSVYNWKLIARNAIFRATYGYAEEWQEFEKDNLIFYYNKITREYRWIRPIEAVQVTPAEKFCTAHKKKNRRIDQKWYTCDQCNKELKAYENAKKEELNNLIENGGNNNNNNTTISPNNQLITVPPQPPQTSNLIEEKGGGATMIRICEPCIYRCHKGHKGVRLVRISPITCGCCTVCQPVNPCVANEISSIQLLNIKLSCQQLVEDKRLELYNMLMPPVFALVPKYSPDGKLKRESGYMMCRKYPPNNIDLQKIIKTRIFDPISEDNSVVSAVVNPINQEVNLNQNINSSSLSVTSNNSNDLENTNSLNNNSHNNNTNNTTINTEDLIGKGNNSSYISFLENNIIGNIYTDDREQNLLIENGITSLQVLSSNLILFLRQSPQLLVSNELTEAHLNEGWIVVMDSEEPDEYEPGTKVICHNKKYDIPCYGTIISYLDNGVYLVKYIDGSEERISFENIESVIRRKFYYNTITGYSSWVIPSIENQRNINDNNNNVDIVSNMFGQRAEHLELSGNEWNALKLISNDRRSFKDYDEYEDPFTKVIFYVDTDAFYLEQNALKIQNFFRIKHHLVRKKYWQSKAFTFNKPESVREEEKVKAGWALLRRRSKCIGEFMDVEQYEWEELMDEDSADFFYWQEDTDTYTWIKPPIPVTKYQTKILPLEVGEKVTYLFPGKAQEEEAIVTRIRKDDQTDEEMYDIQHTKKEALRIKWVPRFQLKKLAKSGEELKLAIYAKEWKKQIRRQREKERRFRLLIRQKKQAEELEKRNKMVVVKRNLENLSVASSLEDMEKGRIYRGRLEKVQLQEERDSVISQKRNEAIQKMMDDMNTGKMKLSKSEMISLQRSITMRLEIEGMREKRTAAQNVLLEKRKETKKRLEFLERSLRIHEDHMTTPRSSVRRRLLRQVHFGILRQIRGQVICEWGCGDWVMLGQEQQDHQRNFCSKRIVACPLGCMKKLTEDEWLSPYIPVRDIENEEEKNFNSSSAGLLLKHNNNNKTGGKQIVVSSDSDDDDNGYKNNKAKQKFNSTISIQEHHETDECPKRLVPCPRHCLEWVCAEVLEHHMTELCVKRGAKPIECRLGCGEKFGGTIEQLISAEEDRFEHEQEICKYRMIRCTWRNSDGSFCAAQICATERDQHRNEHIQKMGISTYIVPGTYVYKVQAKCYILKVQLWGAGGGSGHFYERKGGSGGGGAFVEFILSVNPFDIFEVVVGSGGQAGIHGTEIEAIQSLNPQDGTQTTERTFDVIDSTCGIGLGGNPGGGIGYGGGGRWASGGGGGYSMISRRTADGNEVIAVAGGGGGGGSQDGLPGCGMNGPYPGTRIDPRNGLCAIGDQGGAGGDSGNIHFSDFPASSGTLWQGGNGCQFGGGGGGGYAGGGGGGTSPGVSGGGGGGSSFLYLDMVKDYQFIHGTGHLPGGIEHNPPEAVGIGEWDKVGGLCGQGGKGDTIKLYSGNAGAVRIYKQGYFTS